MGGSTINLVDILEETSYKLTLTFSFSGGTSPPVVFAIERLPPEHSSLLLYFPFTSAPLYFSETGRARARARVCTAILQILEEERQKKEMPYYYSGAYEKSACHSLGMPTRTGLICSKRNYTQKKRLYIFLLSRRRKTGRSIRMLRRPCTCEKKTRVITKTRSTAPSHPPRALWDELNLDEALYCFGCPRKKYHAPPLLHKKTIPI